MEAVRSPRKIRKLYFLEGSWDQVPISIILGAFMIFTYLNTRMGIPEKIIPETYEECAQLIVVLSLETPGSQSLKIS